MVTYLCTPGVTDGGVDKKYTGKHGEVSYQIQVVVSPPPQRRHARQYSTMHSAGGVGWWLWDVIADGASMEKGRNPVSAAEKRVSRRTMWGATMIHRGEFYSFLQAGEMIGVQWGVDQGV